VAAQAAPFDLTQVADGALPSSVHAAAVAVGHAGTTADAIAPVEAGDLRQVLAAASGVEVNGYDVASLENSDNVVVVADVVGDATAYGASAISYHFTDLTNTADGTIGATAVSLDGTALAVGGYAAGGDTGTLRNYGGISANALSGGDAQAYAAVIYATFNGIGLLVNGGDLAAQAVAGAGGEADATGAYVIANVASIFNDGNSSAVASAGDGGTATARGARAYGLYAAVSNYGDLDAIADAAGGSATARGSDALGYYGVQAYNAGAIQAIATATDGVASATGSYSLGTIFSAYNTNTGTIAATASGGAANANGVLNASTYIGNAITINEGSISAVADGTLAAYGDPEAVAFGVYNFAFVYDSVVDNRGSITASASSTTDIDPTEGFLQAKAIGAIARNGYGVGDTIVANSGEIGAIAVASTGYAVAWGAVAQSPGAYAGSARIENDGSIWSYAHADIGMATATGAYTVNLFGTSEIVNHGDIVADAQSERGVTGVSVNFSVVYGAKARSLYENAAVSNYGDIEANASVVGGIAYSYGVVASGLYASVNNAAGAGIIATVETELFGGAFVNGVTAGGLYGVDVVNDGSITAYAFANGYTDGTLGFYGASGATGIAASGSFMGDASVVNNGVVNAIAIAQNAPSSLEGGGAAVGIDGYADAVTIANTGSINAIAQAEFGVAGAAGINAHGKYSNDITNAAGASIFAYASAGSFPGESEPGRAFAWGTQTWASDYASTYNAGSIVAHAVVTPDTAAAHGGIAAAYGSTVGRYSGIMASTLVNHGDIEAAAQADFGYATTYGTYVHGRDEATTTNTGSIRANAVAAAGNAFAVGSHAYSLNASVAYNCDAYGCDWANPIITLEGGQASTDNAGDILATASAVGGVGYSYGAATFAAFAAGITNTGHITAITQADDAKATAALATSFYGDATVVNSGDLVAVATGTGSAGAIAHATGVDISAYADASLANSGTITAAAYGGDATAIAVSLESGGSSVLDNTGSIAAYGDGVRFAISASAGTTTIDNQGAILGAIRTADGNDALGNDAGATWWALGESDFGAGDDQLVNHGVLVLDDAAIRFGDGSNTLANFGSIVVTGDGAIDLGGPAALQNDGVISFVDGAADDRLAIVGDFAGEGAIHVDVSGLHQAGDRIYVDGSVVEPTAQTVNVNLLDLPGSATFQVPLIDTTGTLAGEFALGTVQYAQDGFLSMDFSLGRSADQLWLGVDVTGLNGTGSLASVLAPGVQSLVNAQVGTWRQRMGVVPAAGKAGLAPWARVFSDSGEVNPEHSANFGGGGDFGFHQSNHGWELGLDTQPTEHLSVGALISKSQGSQSVDGAGSDRFDGRAFGLYATWRADNGFYLDVSHRWIGVDARLRSAGRYDTEASARAFNVEAGLRAWNTAGGYSLTPQLQYTHTRVGDIGRLDNGQAEFVDDGGVSSRGRIGLAVERSFDAGGFHWTPYGAVSAVHEFDGKYQHAINGGLLGMTRTDGTSALVEFGLGAHRGGLSLTGGVNWSDGGALHGIGGGQLTVRYGW
jgi:outer membrane autotransporter protein